MKDLPTERVARFSALGRLQKAATLRYSGRALLDGYELQVCKEQEGLQREERCFLRGISRESGEMLLEFLYENAVPIEHWGDVLREAQRML